MNREVLFRGKTENGHWVYGSLIINNCDGHLIRYFILTDSDDPYIDPDTGIIDGYITPVIAETVCQFTGFVDKNGTKIFEGDVICGDEEMCTVTTNANTGETSVKRWTNRNLKYLAECTGQSLQLLGVYAKNFSIIGNIYDNPDVLKKEA